MAKILIAEDELIYREYLTAALDAEGHEVRSCMDGRDAIKVGSYFRPDVLIADWMLKSSIHGLHVSRVLRHLNPQQQTILITGFPSADLMLEAETDHVFAFIRKPFDLVELKDKVTHAAQKSNIQNFHSEIGFIEIGENHSVVYANERAAQLFPNLAKANLPVAITSLELDRELLASGCKSRTWFELNTETGIEQRLHIYPLTFADKGNTLLIVLTDEHRFYKKSKLLELLISSHSHELVQHFWPFEGRVLLLDSNHNLRRLAMDLFDSAGALCHSTDSYTAALKIIERDVGIRHIVVDYEMPDRLSYAGGMAKLIEQLRQKLPHVTIVGQSERNRAQEFIGMGVPFFVQKPWTIEQLIDVITSA